MTNPGPLETPWGAIGIAVVLHAVAMVVPVGHSDSDTEPLEYIDFELTELPEPEPVPEPEPDPEPEAEPEAPAGDLVDEPERDPRVTSLETNRTEEAPPEEEVPIVTGIALDSDQLAEGGMAVRVGNTDASGFDAPPGVDPADVKGFVGGGRGGGGTRASVDVKADVLRTFAPIYPKELRAQKIEGRVVVLVEVLPNGRVGRVEVIESDHPLFLASVTRALRRYRFRPAEMNGQKLTTSMPLRFRFRLDD